MPANTRTIPTVDWSPKLAEFGAVVEGLADIAQCLRIVLTTPVGSVPHRPDFGCDLWRYLDQPIASAAPQLVREAVDAIERWEPRVELLGVQVLDAGAAPGQRGAVLTLRLEWRLADQASAAAPSAATQTVVTIGGPA